jgi:methionyl-tRNA formyltransferase
LTNRMTKKYIIASCKSWHRPQLDGLLQPAEAWEWVASPDQLAAAVEHIQPRYVFFLHWHWLVPKGIWSQYECVCFHMTDVPYGRGGSPLQNLIVVGQTETMLTALRMVEVVDAGPVYAKRPMPLQGRAEDIYIRAGQISFDIMLWMVETQPAPEPQRGEVILFQRRKPEQSVMPDTRGLEGIYDHIRMLDAPTYPLAYIDHGDFRAEFSSAELQGDAVHAKVVLRDRK